MIEFLTLFVALTVGIHPVELQVGSTVASVEIFLDGEAVATLSAAPWVFDCDFGQALRPHRLLAVARDSAGHELERREQRVNISISIAQARLVVEKEPSSTAPGAILRLVWEAPGFARPRQVLVRLNGEPIALPDFPRISLPDLDPTAAQIVHAELSFSDQVEANAILTVGGFAGARVETELSGVGLAWSRRRLPKAKKIGGWLIHHGEPLRVVGVERQMPNLIVVRELGEWNLKSLRNLYHIDRCPRLSRGFPELLGSGNHLRFVFPRPPGLQEKEQVIPLSRKLRRDEGRFFPLLTRRLFEDLEQALPEQGLADAVAIAGMVAAGSSRPQGILLVRTGESRDLSRFSPSEVQAYLGELGIPLWVWNPAPGHAREPSQWGMERDISGLEGFADALEDLHQTLKEQIVVWVAGSIPLGEVVRSPEAPAFWGRRGASPGDPSSYP